MGRTRRCVDILFGSSGEKQYKLCTGRGDPAIDRARAGGQRSETGDRVQCDSESFPVLLCGVCGYNHGVHSPRHSADTSRSAAVQLLDPRSMDRGPLGGLLPPDGALSGHRTNVQHHHHRHHRNSGKPAARHQI
ncbi:hypothetical protein INR49_023957 [Caranx melampygus]|nr:hypothetical protein INR49_023957 [Caranx melampygus]